MLHFEQGAVWEINGLGGGQFTTFSPLTVRARIPSSGNRVEGPWEIEVVGPVPDEM